MSLSIISVYLISITSTLILGLFVFFQNPTNTINRVFSALIASIIGWQVSLFAFYLTNDPILVLTFGRLNFAFAELLALFLFSFCYEFPTSIVKIKSYLLMLIYFFSAVIVGLTIFTPAIIYDEIIVSATTRETEFGVLYPLFVLEFILLTLSGILLLLIKIAKLKGIKLLQMFYLLAGVFFGVIFGSITNIFLPLLFSEYRFQQVGLFAPLIFVAFATYAIIKHRLLDIRVWAARTISYSLLLLVVGSLYASGLFIIGNLIFPNSSTTHNFIFSTLLALVMAYSFQPMRRALGGMTDKFFYKGRYDLQDLLKKLSKLLVSTYLIEDLLSTVLIEIRRQVRISQIDIILIKNNKIQTHVSKSSGHEPFKLIYKDLLLLKKYANLREILFEDLNESLIKEFLRVNDIRIVFPLKTKDNFIGFIFLGEKLSGEVYSDQDVRLFELFAPELSLAIQNAEAYDEISQFNATLKQRVEYATRKLKNANLQLKELDHLKDEFLSIASHELRTPMTAIRSYLWMALAGKGGPVSAKQKYYLQRTYSATERMIKLVNDMLNVSRIESGRIALDLSELNMRGLCLEVLHEVKPRVSEVGINIKFSVIKSGDTKPKLLVVGDGDKLKEVLINFISNSIKFTEKDGHIDIVAREENKQVIVEVTDSGIGIDQDSQKLLFQKFGFMKGSYRTNQDASQGTGLGLYICKSIIDLHDGQIWVKSDGKGTGATFGFSLPIYSPRLYDQMRSRHKKQKGKLGLIKSTI